MDYVEFGAGLAYSPNTIVKAGTHLYEVQKARAGDKAPKFTEIGRTEMYGTCLVTLVGTGTGGWERKPDSHVDANVFCCDNTFIVRSKNSGTTGSSSYGPMEGAKWESDGTFKDGDVIWEKVTAKADDGEWAGDYCAGNEYTAGHVFILEMPDSSFGFYKVLQGTTGNTPPTSTDDSETVLCGTLPMRYFREVKDTDSCVSGGSVVPTPSPTPSPSPSNPSDGGGESPVPSGGGEGTIQPVPTPSEGGHGNYDQPSVQSTWKRETGYGIGETMIANGNVYQCVFDGKVQLPSKIFFENITTNLRNGSVFWWFRDVDVETKNGDSECKVIVKNCEGITREREGSVVADFGHEGNPSMTIKIIND